MHSSCSDFCQVISTPILLCILYSCGKTLSNTVLSTNNSYAQTFCKIYRLFLYYSSSYCLFSIERKKPRV